MFTWHIGGNFWFFILFEMFGLFSISHSISLKLRTIAKHQIIKDVYKNKKPLKKKYDDDFVQVWGWATIIGYPRDSMCTPSPLHFLPIYPRHLKEAQDTSGTQSRGPLTSHGSLTTTPKGLSLSSLYWTWTLNLMLQ